MDSLNRATLRIAGWGFVFCDKGFCPYSLKIDTVEVFWVDAGCGR